MQLHKLHKHASELEWSGGGRAQRWQEVGREGEGRLYHDITPPYAAMSWSSLASPQHWRQQEVVRVEAEEVCGASGCWRGKSSTAAGVWTSVWESHMLSECDHLMNL